MKRFPLLACVILLSASAAAASVGAACEPQGDLRVEVMGAVGRPFPKEAEASRKQLLALGTPAIPFLVEIIRAGDDLTPIKKAFLIDVIGNIKGQQSDSALISLLTDADPLVRGLAASHIGRQKIKAAIPNLINLLNDKDVYQTVVQTDPAAEQAILVRDVALEALQATTGITLAKRGSKNEQVKVWLRWWQKQRKSKGGN
jgi:HEAT repeat protein